MPNITIIIPTFNEEKRIQTVLANIKQQTYDSKKIEIIIVDDGSTDKTVEIAKRNKAKVVHNGTHDIERGKSIGLANATSEYIFFIDADNKLTNKNWLVDCVDILENNKYVVGVQSYRYAYKKEHNAINRYCELFGINDPLAFYLGKRGQLMQYEKNWIYPDTLIKETSKYYLVKFNPNNLPTIGSQGYITRKSLLKKTNWKPYLFHMDSALELVEKGYDTFAMIKYDVEHDYVVDIAGLARKYRRNIALYYKNQEVRRYKYNITKFKLVMTLVKMSTLVIPLKDSLIGFFHKKDYAWFLHPFICVLVIYIYTTETIKFFLQK